MELRLIIAREYNRGYNNGYTNGICDAAAKPVESPANGAEHTELAIAARGVVMAFDLGYKRDSFALNIQRLRAALQQQAGR